MSGMRKLERTVAANRSYKEGSTTDMLGYFFTKLWREKGHPASKNPVKATKKNRKHRRKA